MDDHTVNGRPPAGLGAVEGACPATYVGPTCSPGFG